MKTFCTISNERIQRFWKKHDDHDSVSQSTLETLVSQFLNDYWEIYGIEPDFETVCDITEVHQDIVRPVYDSFMSEEVI